MRDMASIPFHYQTTARNFAFSPKKPTGRLVFQLKTYGHDEGEDTFEKRLAIPQQLKIGRFVSKIHGEGPVFAGLVNCVSHGSSSGQMVGADDDPRWGEDCTIARGSRRVSGLHH